MTADTPAAVVDLLSHIESALVSGVYGPFLPFSALQQYYANRLRVLYLLRSLDQSPTCYGAIQDGYPIVFTILVIINKTGYFRHFTRHTFLSDRHLPFRNHNDWPEDCQHFFNSFRNEQWRLCPQNFGRQQLDDLRLQDEVVLPVTRREPLGRPGNSTTFKIEVHPDYDNLSDENGKGVSRSHVYVLKVCSSRNQESYLNEVEAYTLLMQQEDRRGNNEIGESMVKLFGCFRQRGAFHLLLEYADRETLESFLQNVEPPRTQQDLILFWRNFGQLIKPLQRIHELRCGSKQEKIFQGIHQDIKPANILLSSRGTESKYDVIFKLADFGLLRFEPKLRAGEFIESSDRCGTQVYSAPECLRDDVFLQGCKLLIDPSIDIWSLGCIISEISVWSYLGKNGLAEYVDLRTAETSSDYDLKNAGYSGCFHDGHHTLRTVHEMNTRIRASLRPGDSLSHEIMAISDDMLEEALVRPKAYIVHKRFQKAIRNAEDLLNRRRNHLISTGPIKLPYPPIFCTDAEINALKAPLPKLPPEQPKATFLTTFLKLQIGAGISRTRHKICGGMICLFALVLVRTWLS
ncbi:kinase-like protein [Lindgomyces ingoldianus]|uniref:Kinase-like protein n=1 Tax=Lindgomyces ingoldianus TaxID=673940 RepID=A0ACB6R1E7_9PLEO|nr:kinase-like protein [Lindgomyces ingoldianus]KAF2473094.1 kinase-like protein [Lindgomyces ingoldianus]